MFLATVHVFIKPAVLNPAEGPTQDALHKLGFTQIKKIEMGKCFHLDIDALNAEEAKKLAEEMCKALLASPVTESFKVVSVVSGAVVKAMRANDALPRPVIDEKNLAS